MAGSFLIVNGQIIQGFPLIPGQVLKVAGDGAKQTKCFCCAVDGDFTVTFQDGTGVTISLVAGDSFTIPGGGSVLAVGGAKFHYV